MSVVTTTTTTTTTVAKPPQEVPLLKKLRNPSTLQLKLERQLQKSRAQYAKFKTGAYKSHEKVPLVFDTSEDDFEDINLKITEEEDGGGVVFKQPSGLNEASKECREQLLTDGFRLDEMSDDEDLDLILRPCFLLRGCGSVAVQHLAGTRGERLATLLLLFTTGDNWWWNRIYLPGGLSLCGYVGVCVPGK